MGFLIGFSPWIVYWILVGNMPFRGAVLIALGLSVIAVAVQRIRKQPWHSLEVGAVVVFVILSVLSFTVSDRFLEQWLQPLGNAGIFLVALTGLLIGRPFVREYAAASVDAATARSDGFRVITTAMTWMWTTVFALMTLISCIPPIIQGQATIRDGGSVASVLCYWVIPFTMMGLAGTASGVFPSWFDKKTAAMSEREGAADPGAPVPQPPAAPPVTDPHLQLQVPHTSRHDEPFAITVSTRATSPVALSVSGADLYGRMWTWRGSVENGQTIADEPIWAMQFDGPADRADLFIPPEQPWQVRVEASVDGRSAALTCLRRATDPAVEVIEIDVDGRRALLAVPASATGPAVVCFGGSEGGVDSQRAAVCALASRGVTALAYAWLDDGPDAAPIADIPLERFAAAVHWLSEHVGGPVAAMGISRGAEGLAATLAREADLAVSAVILLSPSSVTWQAIGPDGEIPGTSSWTHRGQPCAYAPLPSGALMPQLVGNAWRLSRDVAAHRPTVLRLNPAYEEGLARDVPPDAVIAAEAIGCPVLTVSGSDDELWPSESMADALLGRRNNPADRHIRYEGAGHFLRPGLYPSTVSRTGGIALGGRPADQAAACLSLTEELVGFLVGARHTV
ncbi:acyl-CoA thioester hydrolase/BAAT C-terminal domain-containing protein [Gordonia sp. N1V]|uniref:acyl-CoA thioester hydrolase/BAAT C-terminal domain-containing protein n=1 Tax=Gordonia sp. N1V TaxID=3034163 RepID=UPI0023E12A8B|nr:acyl-CoA thioester hydrolase/BAAT C-terminal domain-containing protein [Gordonia sp. N1V]MDF3283342.1 acyl-CoA thioester hydrolase/BAAT C-terminal domain-containing protein [Gordonia sp. N1V]